MTLLSLLLASLPPLPAPDHPPAGRYEFVPRVDQFGFIATDDAIIAMRVDRYGNLHERARFRPGLIGGGFMLGDCLNGHILVGVPSYQLWLGRFLVPGTFNDRGKFVPTPGGPVTRFKDYRYSPTVPPIWNLPGRLRPTLTAAGRPPR